MKGRNATKIELGGKEQKASLRIIQGVFKEGERERERENKRKTGSSKIVTGMYTTA